VQPVEGLRELGGAPGKSEPAGRIIALAHPIDMALHVSGDDAFKFIETRTKSGT
jgi:hypothetical protein